MGLEITERLAGGVLVMELAGTLTVGEEAGRLRARLKEVLGDGTTQLVLDLSRVHYIDSAGLGAIVSGHTTARNMGGSVKLANLGNQFRAQLKVSKLTSVFDVYDTVEEAMRSFAPSP